MNILFFGTKKYDREFFEKKLPDYPQLKITFIEANLSPQTAMLATGYKAICAFVNSDIGEKTLEILKKAGVKLILMRCSGFNNVNLEKAKQAGITVVHVPRYSPQAVAEYAMALALVSNRRIHKSYIKCRENDFALTGLMGINFYGKTAGIIGTGQIGRAMAEICRGFGMRVLGYDEYKSDSNIIEYVDMETLLNQSDLISLHCPLTEKTHHLICKETIEKMKDGVVLVNTSRGGLVDTDDLIAGIREGKFFSVGLDVYEEEDENVYEDLSDSILQSSTIARLLSFPNVVVTSHQGFFTVEALEAISDITLKNAVDFDNGKITNAVN